MAERALTTGPFCIYDDRGFLTPLPLNFDSDKIEDVESQFAVAMDVSQHLGCPVLLYEEEISAELDYTRQLRRIRWAAKAKHRSDLWIARMGIAVIAIVSIGLSQLVLMFF